MDSLIYLNGSFVCRSEARVSVFDHGLLYGDGVFEGIRAYRGMVFRLDDHLRRLYRGARAITLEIPLSFEEMRQAVVDSLRVNHLQDAYIRLVVTRGEGDLGLDPRKCWGQPMVIIIADEIKLYPDEFYQHGLEVITVSTRRNTPAALNPAIKSLNYLNNIMAKIEVGRAGLQEGIMLNEQGFVAEATGDNVFIYKDERLLTPPAHIGILEGITRASVIELAQQAGLTVSEEVFTQFDIYSADECFLTGTAAEIVPVIAADGRKIGAGRPGPITKDLIERFRRITTKLGVPIGEAPVPLSRKEA